MIMSKSVILLFEDTEATALTITRIVEEKARGRFEIVLFSASQPVSAHSFVARIKEEINRYGEISLIVSDMDLSKTPLFQGLTDAVVTRVAQDLGIPTAYYSTTLETAEGQRQDRAGDGRILLGSTDYEIIGHKIALLASGFAEVRRSIEKILALDRAERPADAPKFLAELVRRPEAYHKIGLYVAGDQRMGAEILSGPKRQTSSRQAAVFGTWIYDSLMSYPGVLVNYVAAASYLNISIEDFGREDVAQIWQHARYDGPFADSNEPLLWRDMLDRFLASAGADDGLELLRSKGIEVQPCYCTVDSQLTAGYYCMVTKVPVSYENSVGSLSWFPPGADLARVSKPAYDELAPWLEM
jgi:hypothetical protein